jgi:transcriptional regulator with XRE-family HTH domain
MARGRKIFARIDRLRETLEALKLTRESLGLSLQEVGDRTGIGKANLSRLENSRNPNPKIDTLARYAEALGKDLVLSLRDESNGSPTSKSKSKGRAKAGRAKRGPR